MESPLRERAAEHSVDEAIRPGWFPNPILQVFRRFRWRKLHGLEAPPTTMLVKFNTRCHVLPPKEINVVIFDPITISVTPFTMAGNKTLQQTTQTDARDRDPAGCRIAPPPRLKRK